MKSDIRSTCPLLPPHLSASIAGPARLEIGARPESPPEQRSGVALGLAVHLLPAVVFVAALEALGTSLAVSVPLLLGIALLNLFALLALEHRRPSVALPRPTRAQVKEGLRLVFSTGVGVGSVVVLGGFALLSLVSPLTGLASGWTPVIAAVVFTDFAYYWVHRSLNHGKGASRIMRWYRRSHAAHHSVEELDFLRGNISSFWDTAVTGFQLPLILIATLLGLDFESTFIAYGLVLMLQATHHVNHTFDLGPLRWVFMDNHAHKLHHCKRGRLVNHAALFSLWDRAFGTYYEDWDLRANHLAKEGIALPLSKAR